MDLHYIPSTRPPPTVFPDTLFALRVCESNTQHQTSTNNPNFLASLSASLVFKTIVRCFAVSVLEEKNKQDTLYVFHFTTCFHLVCLKANSLNRPDGTMTSVFFFLLVFIYPARQWRLQHLLFSLSHSRHVPNACIPCRKASALLLPSSHTNVSSSSGRTLCRIDPQHPKSPPRLSGVLGQTLGYSLALLPTTLTQRSKPKAALAAAGTCGEVSERFAFLLLFFFFFSLLKSPGPFPPAQRWVEKRRLRPRFAEPGLGSPLLARLDPSALLPPRPPGLPPGCGVPRRFPWPRGGERGRGRGAPGGVGTEAAAAPQRGGQRRPPPRGSPPRGGKGALPRLLCPALPLLPCPALPRAPRDAAAGLPPGPQRRGGGEGAARGWQRDGEGMAKGWQRDGKGMRQPPAALSGESPAPGTAAGSQVEGKGRVPPRYG